MKRWGHSAVLSGSQLVVFGGFGGAGLHARLDDVVILDTATWALTAPQTSGSVLPFTVLPFHWL